MITGSESERINSNALKQHNLLHAYQSLTSETAINTELSELFSLKRIYVKYKNAILSNRDCFLCTWKN